MEQVDHPEHYTRHPSGVECITITEHFNFCIGNAIKYLWRAGLKGDAITDLNKAQWYIRREIERLQGKQPVEATEWSVSSGVCHGRQDEYRDGSSAQCGH